MTGTIWSGMLFLPGEIYLAASAPIRVGGEELGTITVGRRVDEELTRELCRETGSQVTFFAGARLAATSWPARARPELLQALRPTLAAPAPPAGSQSPSAAAGGTRRFAMQLGGQQFMGLLIPLRSQERATGYLLIQSSLDEALRPYIHFQRALDGVGLMGLLVAILGSVIVAGGVTRPLQRIARAADGLMQGDWSQRTPVTSRDEVGLLAETFNLMAERLESWDSDLRAAVADRTRELNAAVARSEVAYQQLRRFNADASHELRTPLTVIRGEAEVALRAARRPEEYRAVLRGIQEETERMSRIIEQLLLLARADSGELRLERRPLALDDLVREVAHRAQVLAGARRIRLLTPELAPTLLEGDEDYLHQLVLNLIDNAIKYTPEGGEVRVRLTAAPERAGLSAREAVLAVEDSGIGIAAADLPHLFDRFYRVDKARSRAQGSCGLGLAICHWIVAAHGGRIEVRSDPGAGSTFSVWLPGAIVPAASEQWEGAAAD
jgi:signal transduction histidine kinase